MSETVVEQIPPKAIKFIDAAYEVLRKKGASELTLEEVARTANASKGGMTYYFSSKEALLNGMLDQAFANFRQAMRDLRANDDKPGAWTRAFLRLALRSSATHAAVVQIYVAAMSAGYDVTRSQVAFTQWLNDRLEDDGIDPIIAHMVSLAADGLNWAHAITTPRLDKKDEHDLVEYLLQLTESPPAAG